ncbi:MAG: hypothetical protein ACREXM_19710 [Gammaproteobacteria bacterium]
MTESFILMALGIGIGYSIALWLPRSRAATVAATGTNTDTQSVAHGHVVSSGEAIHAQGSQMGTCAKSIDEQVRESGADMVMFFKGEELIVVNAKTRVAVPASSSLHHGGHHDAEIRFNELGEPVLFDTKENEDMVRHEKGCNGFRVSTPISKRVEHARVIYSWRYTGSHCRCCWSGGDHYVDCT